MNLKEYIENLPIINVEIDLKAKTIKEIAEATRTTRSTVYRWISGEINPPMLKQEIIARLLGKEVKVLFPDVPTK